MDARFQKTTLVLSLFISLLACDALGATIRVPNFIVTAPTPEIARQVGITAERYRKELAKEWLGQELRNWDKPCKVTVKVGQIGAGGKTSFAFDRGEVFGWDMHVQGTLERILDSVIPHEVSHTIFACYFRRPLPRWADEGAATLVEHDSERTRQVLMLKQVFHTPRRIPLRKLLTIKEYPTDMQDVLTLYAQGYSLADFLVQKGGKEGKQKYLYFLNDAHKHGWNFAIRRHYRLKNVESLEKKWSGWVIAGSPQLDLPDGAQLADANNPRRPAAGNVVFRSQNPEQQKQAPAAAKSREHQQRGHGLLAPQLNTPADPGALLAAADAAQHKSFPKVKGTAEADRNLPEQGLRRAIKQGWAPAEETRLPRPGPLMLRQSFRQHEMEKAPSDNEQASAPARAKTSRDLRIPMRVKFDLESEHHPDGEQELSSGRSPDWSDFPQHRTRNGATRLGDATDDPDSP